MRRWAWLFALPYFVTVTTDTLKPESPIHIYCVETKGAKQNRPHFCFIAERWMAEDMAEALNAAHERRTKKEPDYLEMSKQEFERLLDEVQDGGGKCK